jgi:hypothetical protein
MRDYSAGRDSSERSTIVTFIVWSNTMCTVTVYEKTKRNPIDTFYNESQISTAAYERNNKIQQTTSLITSLGLILKS